MNEKKSIRILLPVIVLGCLTCSSVQAEVVVRLAFLMPANRVSAFEPVYREKLAPIIERYGWPAIESQRETQPGIYALWFVLDSPEVHDLQRRRFFEDLTWKAAWGDVHREFGNIGWRFERVVMPAVPDTVVMANTAVVPAGSGKGHWRYYDVADGLISGDHFSGSCRVSLVWDCGWRCLSIRWNVF